VDDSGEAAAVKYMIMMFGNQAGMMESRSVEWIREMIQFMHRFNDDLQRDGVLVSAQGLVDATMAKTVDFQNGVPVPTDGPFAESKESLAGYWILDVENEARAIELASRVVTFTERPVEVRRIADGPPEV
jgi:hypothetical protein